MMSGLEFKLIRKGLGLTQIEMGEEIHRCRRTVIDYEKEVTTIPKLVEEKMLTMKPEDMELG